MNQPVNVYGSTLYYEQGMLEAISDGFGYRDESGVIIWYDGYQARDDESHSSTIISYGGGCDLEGLKN